MIALRELNSKKFKTDSTIDANLLVLLERINKIRTAWGKPMSVTSGLRDLADHKRIYHERGIFDDKIPMHSQHLLGAAVDIDDPDGSLFNWCKDNVQLLEQVGLWCEEKDDQHRVHFQIFPPKSGHRFFYP